MVGNVGKLRDSDLLSSGTDHDPVRLPNDQRETTAGLAMGRAADRPVPAASDWRGVHQAASREDTDRLHRLSAGRVSFDLHGAGGT